MTHFTRGITPFVVKASVGTADSASDIRVSTDGSVHLPGTIAVSVVSATTPSEAVTATGYIAIEDSAGTTWYIAAYTSTF